MQKDAAHESLKREYESRAGLEQLLRGYKDEVVTLKEALQIAAQAVAEAAINESSPADPGLYEFSEAAIVESSFASYPAVVDNAYSEEYYHQEVAAVHPTELQTDLETQYWQESEGYHHQVAAVAEPTDSHELEEVHFQESEREDHHLETAAVDPMNMLTEVETGHGQESERSENEFEDAVDE